MNPELILAAVSSDAVQITRHICAAVIFVAMLLFLYRFIKP